MNKTSKLLASIALSLAGILTCRAQDTYRFEKEIRVGGEGGWDYLSVDSDAARLYVSHATKVVVIDLEKQAVIGEITNTPGVHGIAVAPKLNRGFVSDGRSNTVSIVDLKTLQTVGHVETEKNPDAILFEPGRQEVYAFNGRSGSATVFEAGTGHVITNIPLAGKPEFAQADTAAGRVYDNLEDKSELVAIDAASHEVVNRWPVAPGEEPSGLAYDEKTHHLFIGCGNKLMVMMDAQTGKVLGSVPIGDGVDACSFDPGAHLAFASCGDSTTTIAREDGDKLTPVQTLQTQRRARTMTLDPKTHKIYLATAEYPAGTETERRPQALPDSFKVLVYGPASAPRFTHPRDITNTYLPLGSLKRDVLASKEETVERTAKPDLHKTFQVGGQTIEALAVEDKETVKGKTSEITIDYFAQDDDGNVYYLGEDVDEYKNGKVSGHGGAWLMGKDTQTPGVIMPAHPKVGDKFDSENVPGITSEHDEVVSVSETATVPLGTFKDCLKVKEVTSDGTEYKLYAPGVGCIQEAESDGEIDLKSHAKR